MVKSSVEAFRQVALNEHGKFTAILFAKHLLKAVFDHTTFTRGNLRYKL